MPQEESKPIDAPVNQEAVNDAVQNLNLSDEQPKEGDSLKEAAESSGEDNNDDSTQAPAKKSKKKKIKDAVSNLTSSSKSPAAPTSAEDPLPASTIDKLSDSQINALVQSNPALAQAMLKGGTSLDARSMRELLKSVSAADLMTGMSSGKNAKDMANYKFWSTQPVPRFDEKAASAEKSVVEGPIKEVDPTKVSTKPSPLVAGFEWSEIDLLDEAELKEVQELLCNHYVEDDEAMFRFNYLNETLNWALKAPGWRKSWHVGVRATKSRKLVAFISGVPVRLNVRDRLVNTAEINFLCVHKKLRSKRLAPVLIMEITRRCNLEGIYQAIYTAGVVLPKPVASCRYFHRALDWEKLYNVGFSPLPHGSTKMRQISKYRLPERTVTPGLRLMRAEDADQVTDLLQRYMKRVKMAQEFNKEEVLHWFVDKEADPKSSKRVVWTYVVEDANKKITDFFSFYSLESSVIHNASHQSTIRAAYLFYYATESAFEKQNDEDDVLKARLNLLVKDALILAKQAKFDVFNALTLLDNPLFLSDQKFGPGDGQLHYYLFNYRTADLPSGVDAKNQVDARQRGGVGVVML
ncbi:Glycylpeptide N-tetradecanoyltransferase, partial [Aureobasidium melanogenum]